MIRQDQNRHGFSLVELVIVVVIIGIISAIAVPRISNAARGSEANALQASVGNVRKAIDQYFAEHNQFPGYDPDNGSPDGGDFKKQLTRFSDFAGNTSKTKSSVYRFGPYLRPPLPTNPINEKNKVYVKAFPADANPGFINEGWIAVLSTGDFGVNASTTDIDDLVKNVTADTTGFKSRITLE